MQLQQAIEHLQSIGAYVSSPTYERCMVCHGVVYQHRTYYVYQLANATMAVIGIPQIGTERPISVTSDIDTAIGR